LNGDGIMSVDLFKRVNAKDSEFKGRSGDIESLEGVVHFLGLNFSIILSRKLN